MIKFSLDKEWEWQESKTVNGLNNMKDDPTGLVNGIYEHTVESYEDVSEAEKRKATPIYSGVVKYFPNALRHVAQNSFNGNKQHNIGDELYWDKSKSADHEDAMMRHLINHAEDPYDTDGQLHLAKVAWRALASLEMYLEHQAKVGDCLNECSGLANCKCRK